MKLSEWARRSGVHYQTAWECARDGKIPVRVIQTPSGSWIVPEPPPENGRAVGYCRASSADQRADLERQTLRVVQEANRRGIAIADTITEVGSGMNTRRRTLARILSDPAVTVIVVEHRDRLACFGVEHLEAALSVTGCRIVVLDDEETTDDRVGDVTEVLTSLRACLYGRRSAASRAKGALAAAAEADK